jgi:hypothetical protein
MASTTFGLSSKEAPFIPLPLVIIVETQLVEKERKEDKEEKKVRSCWDSRPLSCVK